MTPEKFPRSSVTQKTSDAAKNHAQETIQQAQKVRDFAQKQIENNAKAKNNPTIAEAAQTAKAHSEKAIQFAQESLNHAQDTETFDGEASHQAFEQAVQSHIEAAKALNEANQALQKINQQHLQAIQDTNAEAESDESAPSS